MGTPKDIRRGCETCLFMVTHEKCDGCLGEPEVVDNEYRYAYANWQPATFGEAMLREHEKQVSGERDIVVGGQGEATVNARWTLQQAHKHLVRISHECGYMTCNPKFSGDEACIRVLAHGEWFLIWKSGVLDRIENRAGVCQWSRHPDFIKLKYPKEWRESYGFPRNTRYSGSCAHLPKSPAV